MKRAATVSGGYADKKYISLNTFSTYVVKLRQLRKNVST
jgi:hypothetical protein